MPRIVSLIASATEIVQALGMGDFMVARSHECDFPTAVLSLSACTSPKFAISGLLLRLTTLASPAAVLSATVECTRC